MTDLETLRHSAAHILATAMLEIWPEAQFAAGPPVDQGFYYDVELPHRISPEDFPAIEEKMRGVINARQPFVRSTVNRSEAQALAGQGRLAALNERPAASKFKLDILQGIAEGQEITFFQNGPFIDLCAGPHVPDTGHVGAIKLTHVASAYYKGDERNPQLQRIYGTAFKTQEELDQHFILLEEAKKRDHRKLGAELHLFQVDATVGSGLPVLLPKGAVLRRELERLIEEKLEAYDYDRVYSPHIGSVDLYETSGHYPFYAEGMYDPLKIEERAFLLKPMNCPMHMQAYLAEPRSYRDLPQRYAEFGTVYRKEQSGELNGLVRVRGFTQDDGHVFCMPEQLDTEFKACLRMVQEVMAVFGLQTKCRVSLRDPQNPDKYVGSAEAWEQAEAVIQRVVQEMGLVHTVGLGEAAFYGPKLDFIALDALGRGWQLSTIQVDFTLPERFDLTFIGSDGQKHRPVMLHRAVFGSIERFLGLVIEHYAGAFPTWLAPEQVRLLPITDAQLDYAEELRLELKKRHLRVKIDSSREKIGAKIRLAQVEKVPYMLVLGKNEVAAQSVSVRSHRDGDLGVMERQTFTDRLTQEVSSRSL
jgi:threonyl-tRNA synthetase